MEAKNEYLSPQEIREGLINNDKKIINKYFTGEQFEDFLNRVFKLIFEPGTNTESAKAMLSTDLYFYLTENDSKRLREYNEEKDGDFFIWLKRKAINFYRNANKTDIRRQAILKREEKKEKIVNKDGKRERLSPLSTPSPEDEILAREINERIEKAISLMENTTYAEIMRRELITGDFDAREFATEFDIKYGNMSMNKSRAYLALWNIYKTF